MSALKAAMSAVAADAEEDEEEAQQIEDEINIRKAIRAKQRNISNLAYHEKDKFADVRSSKLDEVRKTNNDLWAGGMVAHSRELQNDALILRDLAYGIKAQSAAMDDSFRSFDMADFARLLKQKYCAGDDGDANRPFSWSALGRAVGIIPTSVPTYNTMVGPLSKEIKVRRVGERKMREKITGAAEKPVDVEQEEEDEATNERLLHLQGLLVEKTKTASGEYFDLLNTLVDPNDRVQTIENFFDFCFVIKEKQVVVHMDPQTHLPMALGVASEDVEIEDFKKHQMVLTLDMGDLELLTSFAQSSSANRAKVLQPFDSENPLHRLDPLYAARNAHEQAKIAKEMEEEKKQKRMAEKARKIGQTGAKKPTGAGVVAATNRSSTSSSSGNKRKSTGDGIVDENTQEKQEEEEEEQNSNVKTFKSTASSSSSSSKYARKRVKDDAMHDISNTAKASAGRKGQSVDSA